MYRKDLLFAMVAILLFSGAHAQISLENTYTGAAEVADAGTYGYKYFVTDYLNNQVVVYNEDHSPWKTIPVQVPDGNFIYDVAYVTTDLFNKDALVELLVVSYAYIAVSDTSGYYDYTTEVLNENGSVLVSVPGGGYAFTYADKNGYNKLVVYTYDYAVSAFITSTRVYGLPAGTSSVPEPEAAVILPYPNPSSGNIALPLPGDQQPGTTDVVIYDINGKECSRTPVPGLTGRLSFNTSVLSEGQYFYRVESNGKSMPAGRFTVTR